MTWDESEHPRDEDGKFTFKNGGTTEKSEENKKESEENQNQNMTPFKLGAQVTMNKSEIPKTPTPDKPTATQTPQSPADILYEKTKEKERTQKEKNRYKNILLDTLGSYATTGDILLGKKEDLEKKIKEQGLEKFLEQKKYELGIGSGYDILGRFLAEKKFKYGPDTLGMLDLAHENKRGMEYAKDAIKLKNFDDVQNEDDKKYLVHKLNEQFADYTDITNIENIKGYEFPENSEPSKRMAQHEDFHKILRENKEVIFDNKNKPSGAFPKRSDNQKANWRNAIGSFDIRNARLDNEGNLHLQVYDTYEFDKDRTDVLNKAGAEQMHAGNLKPFFTIHDVLIPKSDLDKIWK